MSRQRTFGAFALAFGLIALAAVGCQKPKFIPKTRVVDTKLNREVLQVVERYRLAMERRDTASVLALVHPTYRDQSGTPEADDDLDFEQLKNLLKTRFKRATRIRYHIEYQGLQTKGREAHVDTWIDATFVYEQPDAMPRWRRFTDYNRYRLIKEGASWRFIGGL